MGETADETDRGLYQLGSVTIEEIEASLAEIVDELADPNNEDGSRIRREIGEIRTASVSLHEEGDGGAIILIVIGWLGGKIADKAFDIIVDDYLRPRLRAKFGGRDLGPTS